MYAPRLPEQVPDIITEASMQSGAMTVREVAPRREFTFVLDGELVERAMHEVGETDMVRSIEAALAAAIDYQLWVREVVTGQRGAAS